MGQYYKAINFDKKEVLYPYDYDNGLKLLEFSWIGNNFMNALENKLAGDWKGDRVLLIGDYAASEELESCDMDTAKTITELEYEFLTDHSSRLYHLPFREIVDEDDRKSFRYLFNDSKKQFVDTAKAPVSDVYVIEKDDYKKVILSRIHPLSILLATSSGLGGGDYFYDAGEEYIGSWVEDMGNIAVGKTLEGREDYKEIMPNFQECDYSDGKYKSWEELILKNVKTGPAKLDEQDMDFIDADKVIKLLNNLPQ